MIEEVHPSWLKFKGGHRWPGAPFCSGECDGCRAVTVIDNLYFCWEDVEKSSFWSFCDDCVKVIHTKNKFPLYEEIPV